MNTNIIFFGSTTDSVIVLQALSNLSKTTNGTFTIVCVVTQPPRPIGRKQIQTPTPVEIWAKTNNLPVLSFPSHPEKPWLYEHEETVIDTLSPFSPDLFVSASYGQKIPMQSIANTRYGGINIHPSLIPRWRGADPVPWAILAGDAQTGVTVMTLADKFDEGRIIAQQKISITHTDTSDPLRTNLFRFGSLLLTKILPDYLNGDTIGTAQNTHNATYAGKLSRQDGFIPWELLVIALEGKSITQAAITRYTEQPIIQKFQKAGVLSEFYKTPAILLERVFRAFFPWPGLWTIVPIDQDGKRLKIISCNLQRTSNNLQLIQVQLEGKNPVSFAQFSKAYRLTGTV